MNTIVGMIYFQVDSCGMYCIMYTVETLCVIVCMLYVHVHVHVHVHTNMDTLCICIVLYLLSWSLAETNKEKG